MNTINNKYCCSRCGIGGFSIGLYAKMRHIDTKKAYKELLERECFSIEKSNITISPINLISDIEERDKTYRSFLEMLKLDAKHKKYLQEHGFLNSTIENQMYRTIPKNYIKRRLICKCLKSHYNLEGIPGFYQEEDFAWNFSYAKGFFIPVFDEMNRIQALSINLDNPYNEMENIWFSSNSRINGTGTKNWISKSNINVNTKTVFLTDSILLSNLIRDSLKLPVIAFSNINNSYQILKVLDNTNIENIVFILRKETNKNLDYIIKRVFKDLIPLGYNLEMKYIREFKDIFDENFNVFYTLKSNKIMNYK